MLGVLDILLSALLLAVAAVTQTVTEHEDSDITQALSNYTVDVSDLPLHGLQEERTLESSCLIAVCIRIQVSGRAAFAF